MIKKLLFFLVLTIVSTQIFAQRANIRAIVTDTTGLQKLQNSSVLLVRVSDSVLVKSMRTDANGSFEFKNIQKGRYNLIITYPKLADFISTLNLSDSSKIDLGQIRMELKSKVIEEVIIQAKRAAIRVRGDTTTYVADSFKVEAGANVQELLKRLPGFQVDKDGVIKAQGEQVTNVLVDGDEFFGDDPLLATKYLKASAVKEVEVYDKKSKNTELTGIDDGKKEKTVNIKLKDGAKNGYIANIDGNSNGSNFNDYGGMFGIFKNKLKAAVFGTQSNIGLFSPVNRAMNSVKGNDYDIIEVSDGGGIVMMGGMSDSDDFFNPQNGLPNNLTLGAHVSNKWNDNKRGFKLNYKYLDRENTNLTTSNFQRLLPNQDVFISTAATNNLSVNRGNDIKGTYDITIDSLSTVKVSFGFKDTNGDVNTTEFSETHTGAGVSVSENSQRNMGVSMSGLYNGNVNYSKKFKKKGRTLSIDLQPEFKNNSSLQTSLNNTTFYDGTGLPTRNQNLNLLRDNDGQQLSLGSRISFSEPLTKKLTLQTAYSFKNVNTESYRNSFDNNTVVGGSPRKIDSLSNNFDFLSNSHIGKGVLQWRETKFTLNAGLEATQTSFKLNDLDRNKTFNRSFLNLGPTSNFSYKVGSNSNVSVNYTGTTRQPSLEQLQPIRELTNPLYLIVGNPLLKPSFTNAIRSNFNSFSAKTEQYISAGVFYNFINNEIVNVESIDQNNRRVITYINIDGNRNYGTNIYYDKEIGINKFRMNINASLNYNRSERTAVINGIFNRSLTNSTNAGFGFGFDTKGIRMYYNGNANILTGRSTIGALFAGNSITHDHNVRTNVILPYKMTFVTNVSMSFRPRNAVFTQPLNVTQWDASIVAKAMKNNALQITLGVTDILKERIGYNRSVGGNTISESTYSFIPRYVLLGVNYNISGDFNKK